MSPMIPIIALLSLALVVSALAKGEGPIGGAFFALLWAVPIWIVVWVVFVR